jgi:hypothetical protein
MTPEQAAAAVKDRLGPYGFTWMSSPVVRARAKQELGIRSRAMYHLGRAGVLGDVPVEVVTAVEAFYPPAVVQTHWTEGQRPGSRAVAGQRRRAAAGRPGRAGRRRG